MRAKKLLSSRQIFRYVVPTRTITKKHCVVQCKPNTTGAVDWMVPLDNRSFFSNSVSVYIDVHVHPFLPLQTAAVTGRRLA